MSTEVQTAAEFVPAVVNIATDSTEVSTRKTILRGAWVNTVLSAHALPILNGASTAFTIPASTAAGTWIPFGDVVLADGLVVDPDNAATGNVTFIIKVM